MTHFQELQELGYTLLENVLSHREVSALHDEVERLFQCEGEQAGAEFKQEEGARRLANLMNKGQMFHSLVANREVLACAAQVLGEEFKLSSLNARSANPNVHAPQPLHCDMSAIPDSLGYWVCNAVWLIDEFTKENGALRVVPGSHRWHRLPQDELDDPREVHPAEILLTAKAGTVIVTNAHLWHGGSANRTDQPRTAIHAFYCRRDKPQQQYQKGLLDSDVVSGLSVELRDLLAIDDPINDELSTDAHPKSGFLQ